MFTSFALKQNLENITFVKIADGRDVFSFFHLCKKCSMGWLTAELWPTFYFSFMFWRLRGEPWSLLVHLRLSAPCRGSCSVPAYTRVKQPWGRGAAILRDGSSANRCCEDAQLPLPTEKVNFFFFFILKLSISSCGVTDHCTPTFCPVPSSARRGSLEKRCKDRVEAWSLPSRALPLLLRMTEPDTVILLSTTPVEFFLLKFVFTLRTHIVSVCTTSYVPAQSSCIQLKEKPCQTLNSLMPQSQGALSKSS